MGDSLLGLGIVAAAVAGWFILNRWLLPRLGIAT